MSGCDSIVTTNLTINPAQQVVILEKDTTICEDESLVLHAIGANLYWSTGESTDSIIVSTEGIYSVTSLNGCQTSSSITIFQESCIVTSIFIPNVFTPNGDNQNDFFIVDGINITGIEGVIFNRWGQQLFTWNNINVGWDGTYKNKMVPDGTYFYMIKVAFLDSKKRNLQGSITLLR
jgi:gliding motility-associated-like protein